MVALALVLDLLGLAFVLYLVIIMICVPIWLGAAFLKWLCPWSWRDLGDGAGRWVMQGHERTTGRQRTLVAWADSRREALKLANVRGSFVSRARRDQVRQPDPPSGWTVSIELKIDQA